MKDKVCPKCNSTNVVTNAEANVINLNQLNVDGLVFNTVIMNVYMCVECGYVEYYVADSADREKIAKKWGTGD